MLISIVIVVVFFLLFSDLETYFENTLQQKSHNLFLYSGLSFSVLVADIFLPVPSSLILYLNGVVLGPLAGSLLSFGSVTLSSIIGYYVGAGSRSSFSPNANFDASAFLEKYGPWAVIISRPVPILSEAICFTSGYNRIGLKNFLLWSVIGYIPVVLIYSLFGSLASSTNLFLLSILSSFVLASALFILGRNIVFGRSITQLENE